MELTRQNNRTSSGSGLTLKIIQEPEHAKVAGGKDKDRKPIDPPPILQLIINERDFDRNVYGRPDACLSSPYYFVNVSLINDDPSGKQDVDCHKALHGTTVSSLHKLKDSAGMEGGFFVFGDISVKTEGYYKLRFFLYEMRDLEAVMCTSIESSRFQVHTQRTFPGMTESTMLTRQFSDQGVRLRLRKDSRVVTNRKRNIQRAMDSDQKRGRLDYEEQFQVKRQRQNMEVVTTMGMQSPQGRMGGYISDYDGTYSSPYVQSYSHYITTSGSSHVGNYKGSGYTPLTPTSTTMPSQNPHSATQSPPLYGRLTNAEASQYGHAANYVDLQWQNDMGRPSSPVPGMTGLGL
ncbi:developmental regulator [Colletotrichum truncatum]|uniref:Developmental regulator n=1 Tax=Colletotrichum truncatum TaxID=5467 RepID=A0ACC3ZCX6_COLTU